MPLFIGASESYDTDAWEAYNLKNENTNLRERITTQKQTIQAYRDESREWREVAEHAQAENAKLRELARTLHYCTSSGECDGCPVNSDGTAHLMPDDICDTMLDRMRELGVEVDG